MASNSSIPDYEELSSFISYKFSTLRAPYMEWANLARRAIQGLHYDTSRLSELEDFHQCPARGTAQSSFHRLRTFRRGRACRNTQPGPHE